MVATDQHAYAKLQGNASGSSWVHYKYNYKVTNRNGSNIKFKYVGLGAGAQQGARENGIFFPNETDGYNYMYSNSKGKVELAAYVLENGGIEILPWKYNMIGTSHAGPPDTKNKNARVKSIDFDKGRPVLTYNDGTKRKAVAYIHTHPGGGYLSPDDVKNSRVIQVPNYTLSAATFAKDTYWAYKGKDFGFLQVNGQAIQNTQILSGFSIYNHAIQFLKK